MKRQSARARFLSGECVDLTYSPALKSDKRSAGLAGRSNVYQETSDEEFPADEEGRGIVWEGYYRKSFFCSTALFFEEKVSAAGPC